MSAAQGAKRLFTVGAGLRPRERNEKRFTCTTAKKRNISEFPVLKNCLPDGYDYHVCDYKEIGETDNHVNFRASLRMSLSTKEDIKLWLKSHTVAWRVDRTDPGKGQRVLFKVDFRCQHKTRPRGLDKLPGRSKNTNCPAKMTVTLLRTLVSRGRHSLSTDPHVPTFPTIISLRSDHNHHIHLARAVSSPGAAESGPEEASHRAAATRFAEMCEKLLAMISGDPSFTGSALAAVTAFQQIQHSPAKVMAALSSFGRDTLASADVGAQPASVSRRPPAQVTAVVGHRRVPSAARTRTLDPRSPAGQESEGPRTRLEMVQMVGSRGTMLGGGSCPEAPSS